MRNKLLWLLMILSWLATVYIIFNSDRVFNNFQKIWISLPNPPKPMYRPYLPQNSKRIHNMKNRQDAWIIEVNRKDRLITIQIIDTKDFITFLVPSDDVRDFKKSYIAPISIECSDNRACDYKNFDNLYVSGRLVVVSKPVT